MKLLGCIAGMVAGGFVYAALVASDSAFQLAAAMTAGYWVGLCLLALGEALITDHERRTK